MGQVFGTQIRHACPQPSAIRGLVLPVVRAPFVALLVPALRVRHDDLARLVTAPAGAIFLAPIARPTNPQELLAAGAREEPVIDHDLERADFLPWLSLSGEAASRRRDLARQGRPGVAAPGLRPIGRVPLPRNPPPSGLRNFWRSISRPQITRIGVAGHRRKRAYGAQSDRGHLFAERVMTVAHTARKQDKNVLAFLTACCRGRGPRPSLFAPDVVAA